MIKKILPVFLFTLFFAFPSIVQAACPGNLSPVYRNNGPICMYVYSNGASLPAGCSDANDLLTLTCHPELHGSYLLPGQLILPGDCTTNPPGYASPAQPSGGINPNCGWLLTTSGSWVWNGPGSTPVSPPPNMNNINSDPVEAARLNDVYRTCDAVSAIDAGQTPVVLMSGGTNRPPTSGELTSAGYLAPFAPCRAGTFYGGGVSPTPTPTPTPGTTPGTTGSGGTSAYLNNVLNIINSALQNILSVYSTQTGTSVNISANQGGGSIYLNNSLNLINSSLNSILATYGTTLQTGGINPIPTPVPVGGITVSANVDGLNVRSAPVTAATVVRQLSTGGTFTGLCYVIGETVEGSARWWRTSDNNYVWAGGTVEQPTTLCQ